MGDPIRVIRGGSTTEALAFVREDVPPVASKVPGLIGQQLTSTPATTSTDADAGPSAGAAATAAAAGDPARDRIAIAVAATNSAGAGGNMSGSYRRHRDVQLTGGGRGSRGFTGPIEPEPPIVARKLSPFHSNGPSYDPASGVGKFRLSVHTFRCTVYLPPAVSANRPFLEFEVHEHTSALDLMRLALRKYGEQQNPPAPVAVSAPLIPGSAPSASSVPQQPPNSDAPSSDVQPSTQPPQSSFELKTTISPPPSTGGRTRSRARTPDRAADPNSLLPPALAAAAAAAAAATATAPLPAAGADTTATVSDSVTSATATSPASNPATAAAAAAITINSDGVLVIPRMPSLRAIAIGRNSPTGSATATATGTGTGTGTRTTTPPLVSAGTTPAAGGAAALSTSVPATISRTSTSSSGSSGSVSVNSATSGGSSGGSIWDATRYVLCVAEENGDILTDVAPLADGVSASKSGADVFAMRNRILTGPIQRSSLPKSPVGRRPSGLMLPLLGGVPIPIGAGITNGGTKSQRTASIAMSAPPAISFAAAASGGGGVAVSPPNTSAAIAVPAPLHIELQSSANLDRKSAAATSASAGATATGATAGSTVVASGSAKTDSGGDSNANSGVGEIRHPPTSSDSGCFAQFLAIICCKSCCTTSPPPPSTRGANKIRTSSEAGPPPAALTQSDVLYSVAKFDSV